MLFQAFKKVFRRPIYALFALIAGCAMFAFAVWLPNFRLIIIFLVSQDISFAQKLNLLISLLGSIATNFTPLSASYTIAIAMLFGINLAMIVYFLRRKVAEVKQSGIYTGFLGVASGVLGIGCAACGSFLLTGALAFLPLRGGEFGILGVILLLLSIHLVAKQIQNPAVCKINSQ